MIEHTTGSIEYLSFKSLDELGCVTDVFTTRRGGVSSGYHSSMNLAFTNGDDPDKVEENYRLIAPVIGVGVDHIVRTHQTHTTNVVKVTKDMVYDDGQLHDQGYTDVDGLICDIPGVALATFYADCVPLYFVDPVRNAIGLSHSGWRGTVAGMAGATVRAMHDAYGSDPADIYAAIGPSISKDNYEVSEEVAEAFRQAFGDDAERVCEPGRAPGKYQLDLWEANRIMMLRAGISEDHIEVAGICTYDNSDWLFSHRASGGKRGNMAAFLALKERTPVVSVCMTIYNIESYMRRSIESVLNQTYRNLEIIMVDDGSTDASGSICDEYAANDARIKVIHKANGGIPSTRNACLDAATGDYICWIDGDDAMEPEMIESMLSALLENDADMCACRYRQVFEDHTIDGSTGNTYVYEGRELMEQFLKEDERFLIQNAVWNKLYKRELTEGLRFPEMWYEDMVYTFYLIDRSKRSVYLDTAYYNYTRDRGDSQTNAGINPRTYTDLIPNLYDRSRYLNEQGRRDLALISDYLLYKRLLVYYTKVSRSLDPDKKAHLKDLDELIRGGIGSFDEIYACPIAKRNEYRKLKIYLFSVRLYLITMWLNDKYIIPVKEKRAAKRK